MGVNFTQSCILGWSFNRGQVEKEISPAKYIEQQSYDVRTGQENGTNRGLVKEREYILECAGERHEEMYELAAIVGSKFGLSYFMDSEEEEFFIGIALGDDFDYGRVELLIGDVQLDDLAVKLNKLKDLQEDIGTPDSPAIHFITNVG